MASKRKSSVRPSAATPTARMNALLENMVGKIEVVAEGLTGLRSEMERRFDDAERRNNARFEILEGAIRHNSRMIQGLDTRLGSLEERVERIEKRLDRVELRLDRIEVEIADLRREHRELAARVDASASAREKEAAAITALDARISRLERHVGLVS